MVFKDEMVITYIFRKPKYPVIAEIDGKVFAGTSEKMFIKEIMQIGVFQKSTYDVIDSTGEVWIFDHNELILSPISFKKNKSKNDLINLVNSRIDKPESEVPYSVKSISSKRYETVFKDLIAILKS